MQLNYHCWVNHTGYSVAAQEYILSILRVRPETNIKVVCINRSPGLGVSKRRREIFSVLAKNAEIEPRINIYQSTPAQYRRPRGFKQHIGVCVFETMTPPKAWMSTLNEMDAVITASEFNKRVFETNNVKVPIHVVPHCFDPQMFHKDVNPSGRYGLTTFLSMGARKDRKNWQGLVKAFYDGFEKKDNVCLLIKTDKPDILESDIKRIKLTCEWRSKDTAPIYLDRSGFCEFEDIPKFMKKGDIYVSASLGEGFGLPGLHAMALGLPVITTKYGGVLEYAKEDVCTYIIPKHYKTYPMMDGIPQFRNCIWPVIRISEIRDKMRQVFENYPREKTISAYKYVHSKFTYDVVGKRFLEAIGI